MDGIGILERVKITKGDRIKYLPILSNWITLSEKIQQEDFENEEILLKLIALEVLTKKRVQIIYRLKSRYNRIRNQREMNEIMKGMV